MYMNKMTKLAKRKLRRRSDICDDPGDDGFAVDIDDTEGGEFADRDNDAQVISDGSRSPINAHNSSCDPDCLQPTELLLSPNVLTPTVAFSSHPANVLRHLHPFDATTEDDSTCASAFTSAHFFCMDRSEQMLPQPSVPMAPSFVQPPSQQQPLRMQSENYVDLAAHQAASKIVKADCASN
ncbi:unnamed protein product [Protopolystoma xenopodis]|uniref:Uncharacterized protein n=1 Tax=Protopolystoma xenopodis TaxID=117903 RepID=A0A448WKB8_9PLAT|nr:unnamed protein product [Protopolystoma xenopodis]